MAGLMDDPMHNAVQVGIKDDIMFLLDSKRYRAAVMLIYAGMDAMAFLSMPPGQAEVTRNNFISWADRFIRLPGNMQITGEEYYSARCGLLHSYSPISRGTRSGLCRIVGYVDQCVPEVRYAPAIDPNLVLISIRALKDAFFEGINRFLIAALTDTAQAEIVSSRIEKMWCHYPFPDITESNDPSITS